MNILGVGGPELIAILIIMLVVAGPKRMIHWSYILGQYVAKFRVMWSQTVDIVQKEFDEAGVDIKLPKEPPTRKNFGKAVSDAIKPISDPLKSSLDEVKQDVDSLKTINEEVKEDLKKSTTTKTTASVVAKPKPDKPTSEKSTETLGTWGAQEPQKSTEQSANGNGVDMGTWSSPSTDK